MRSGPGESKPQAPIFRRAASYRSCRKRNLQARSAGTLFRDGARAGKVAETRLKILASYHLYLIESQKFLLLIIPIFAAVEAPIHVFS